MSMSTLALYSFWPWSDAHTHRHTTPVLILNAGDDLEAYVPEAPIIR